MGTAPGAAGPKLPAVDEPVEGGRGIAAGIGGAGGNKGYAAEVEEGSSIDPGADAATVGAGGSGSFGGGGRGAGGSKGIATAPRGGAGGFVGEPKGNVPPIACCIGGFNP